MLKHYSSEFKKSAVEKLLSPNSPGATKVAINLGVPIATLYGWRAKYATQSVIMNKTKSLHKMSREEKLEFLLKVTAMSENELGTFLREKGLHSSDLSVIKNEILNGPVAPKKPLYDPEVAKLKKEVERSAKDLKRKDKALAELSARVILLKKSHEIWGDPEEDE